MAWIMLAALAGQAAEAKPPNVVLVYADDLGWGDLGCQGGSARTPHLDRLAREGCRLTNFYTAQAVCSASRAALLTGCYPNRVGILGALSHGSRIGIHPDERLLPEAFRERGYATAIFGKWHLGHRPASSPLRHGFDRWYGLPYSNDMWPRNPNGKWVDLPTMDGEAVAGLNTDQARLTQDYTERAIAFVRDSVRAGRPFFLYLPHTMPHVPLAVPPAWRGRSGRSPYADVVEHLDDCFGRLRAAIREAGAEAGTLTLFSSDNGPWLRYGDHAGSAGGLRNGKGTAFEGGVRVPLLAAWPGRIPAGRVAETPAMTIDLLPTLARLAGAGPADPRRPIDGLDIWPVLAGLPGGPPPDRPLHFYWGDELHATRSGRWKLHFPHPYRQATPPFGTNGKPGPEPTLRTGLALYDLAADPAEAHDLAGAHPEEVARIQALAEAMRARLGDALTGRKPTEARQPQRFRDG